MATQEIIEYYSETATRDIRADLIFASGLIEDQKIAIDCGCGAGADIAYLRENGFTVFAFDTEEEAISRCAARFKGDNAVLLSQASFNTYEYPESSLIVADASLFFCPEQDFDEVWSKIYTSLMPNGIFCGSFLGANDTMASPDYDSAVYWSNILVFNEKELRSILNKLDVLRLTEHEVSGKNSQGGAHQWHLFSVVAQKKP